MMEHTECSCRAFQVAVGRTTVALTLGLILGFASLALMQAMAVTGVYATTLGLTASALGAIAGWHWWEKALAALLAVVIKSGRRD